MTSSLPEMYFMKCRAAPNAGTWRPRPRFGFLRSYIIVVENGVRMHSIALSSMKRGTGKTTIAFNLAERAFSSGLEVVVLDYDSQQGSIGLMDLRESKDWPVHRGDINLRRNSSVSHVKSLYNCDLVIHDLPGLELDGVHRLLVEMDLVLSPVGVGASDLLTVASFLWTIKRLDLPVVFIPHNIPQWQSRQRELLSELAALEAEVCPVLVQRRVAHLDSVRFGLGVCEAFPGTAAAGEIQALWEWVCRRVGIER